MENKTQESQLGSYIILVCLIIGICSGFSFESNLAAKDFNRALSTDTIPSDKYWYDTTKVFDPLTYTEEVKVTAHLVTEKEWDTVEVYNYGTERIEVLMYQLILDEESIRADSENKRIATMVDTTVIFDPKSGKKSTVIDRVKLPNGVFLLNGLNRQKRAEIFDKIGERTTLSISTFEGSEAINIHYSPVEQALNLTIVNSEGIVLRRDLASKGGTSYNIVELNLPKGEYVILRSDCDGQQVHLKIK